MIIGIYANKTKDINYAHTAECVRLCKELGVDCCLSCDIEGDFGVEKLTNQQLSDSCGVVIVFGGDGTILRYVQKVKHTFKAPILGINLGHIGFLTESDAAGLKNVLVALIEGKYHCDKRVLMKVKYDNKVYSALNDAVIGRRDALRMVPLTISIDSDVVDNYTADGVIVCTPTGSTAYNLSAGGPVLSPDIDAFAVTAICPHRLSCKPMVVADSHVINIRTDSAYASLVLDGRDYGALREGSTVQVSKSTRKVSFVRLDNTNFFVRLKRKII